MIRTMPIVRHAPVVLAAVLGAILIMVALAALPSLAGAAGSSEMSPPPAGTPTPQMPLARAPVGESSSIPAVRFAVLALEQPAADSPSGALVIPPPPPGAVTPATSSASGSGSGARPSDELADPVEDPIGAVADARDAQRQGWPVFALVAIVMLSRGIGTAHRRWPASRWLAWLGGKPALAVGGVGVVAGAAFDALVLSGSWWAALIAAAGAFLLLVSPEPAPTPAPGTASPAS